MRSVDVCRLGSNTGGEIGSGPDPMRSGENSRAPKGAVCFMTFGPALINTRFQPGVPEMRDSLRTLLTVFAGRLGKETVETVGARSRLANHLTEVRC